MAYTYGALVAWDPIGKNVVKGTTFYVYAPSDTGFTNPLAITDTLGNALANLNSGTQGVFPSFQQAQYTAVVLSDIAHTYAWTVNATQGGAVFQWQPNTYYAATTPVIEPGGTIVQCNTGHTSASTYAADAASWNGNQTGVAAALAIAFGG